MSESEFESPGQPGGLQPEETAGLLSPEYGLASLLDAIREQKSHGEILLNLASPSGFISGQLLIAQSRFIVGAACHKNQIQGYDAVCKLLVLTNGLYSWKAVALEDSLGINRDLQMDINALLPHLPFLPNTVSQNLEKALSQKQPSLGKLTALTNPSQWLGGLFSPKASTTAPQATKSRMKRTTSMTLTALKPIAPRKVESYPAAEIQVLLEKKLLRSSSISKTINREFTYFRSEDPQSALKHKYSFESSRSSSGLVPVYVMVALISLCTFAGLLWLSRFHSASMHAAPPTKISPPTLSHRHPTRHKRSY
jgi:hypothetical protein